MQDATFEAKDELPCHRIFLFGLHISVDRQHNLHRVWDGKVQIGFSSEIGTYRNILLVRFFQNKSILIALLIRIPSCDSIELYHGDVDPLTGWSFYDPRLSFPSTAEWRWGISEDVLRSRGGWEQTHAIVVSNYKTNLPSPILEETEKTINRKCSLKTELLFHQGISGIQKRRRMFTKYIVLVLKLRTDHGGLLVFDIPSMCYISPLSYGR